MHQVSIQPHSKAVKSVFYCEQLKKLVSTSLDGALVLTDLSTNESETILKGEALVGCVQTDKGLVAASSDGVIIFFGFDDTVEQLTLKCKDRPASLFYHDNEVLIGDWGGNLYRYNLQTKLTKTFTFPQFNYEERVVPNGVYSLQILNNQIICGLSSGHIGIGRDEFQLLKVHQKGVRSLQVYKNQIISVANDGRCCLTDLHKSTELQSVHSDKEYIFCSCLFQDQVVFGGTSIVAEVVDLQTKKLQQLIPMQSDAWSVCGYQNQLYFGLESGQIVCVNLKEEPNKFFKMSILSQKFTGSANDYLPIELLKEKYNYSSVDELNILAEQNMNNHSRTTPICICFVDNILQCFLRHQGKFQVLGNVDYKTLQIDKKKDQNGTYWDLCFNVSADIGQQELKLYMNIGEDAYVVAKRFLADTGLQVDLKSDQIDQVAQIRQFIEQNAPKVTLLEQYKPDSTLIQNHLEKEVNFEEIKAQSQDSEKSKMELDLRNHCFLEVRQTSEQIAKKAMSQLTKYFNDLELEDLCNLMAEGTYSQFQDFGLLEEHYGQFLCVLSYAFQVKAVEQLDDQYIDFLVERFTMGSKPEQVFSLRVMNYIADDRLYKKILNCQKSFIMKMQENDGQDVEHFVVQMSKFQLKKVFGDDDFVKEVAEGLFKKQ
uniref:PFU (PLAA family ubiquitin binding) domain-containing protein n=1 Tax=Trepomonas sp. PC1 TaxID=1076344 RepID=A0A146KFA7_9EUKA|eukprot:JAP94564.1 PFU (PLAA family ubiquitin binding) domain-containing protein [Trepomonas sp. PC1]